MNKVSVSLGGAILALLLMVAGCASPLANLGGGSTAGLPALAAGETRLVFSTKGDLSESRLIVDDGYLTVQLRSQADGTTKFATATGSAGTYAVIIKGLVAGVWNLSVKLYDNVTDQNLLHYGNTSFPVLAGSTNSVPISLYVPGEIAGVDMSEALIVNHVTITALEAGPKTLPSGHVWDLDAVAYGSTDDSTPATQPAVMWSSSDEDIAWVSSSGRVTVLQPGSVTITARSVENLTMFDTYEIVGAPAVYGDWKWRDPDGDATIFRFTATTFEMYDWSDEGDFDIFRGSYTLIDGILDFQFEEELNKSTRTWGPIDSDMGTYNVFYTWITPNTVEMMPVLGPMAASVSEGGVNVPSFTRLLTRVSDFTETTGVEVSGSSGGNLTVVLGASLDEYQFAATPANATVPKVVWATGNALVMGYDPALNSDHGFRALSLGTATVTAYAATDLTTPIATYNVTVVANNAPTIALSSGATQAVGGIPGAFQVQFNDELRVYEIGYHLKSTTSNWTDQGTAYPPNAGSYAWNFVTNGILSDGAYVLSMTANDLQGNVRESQFTILVGTGISDSEIPYEQGTNFYGSYTIGYSQQSYIQVVDDLTGVDPSTAQLTVNQGTASGIVASIVTTEGGSFYIEIDLTQGGVTPGTGASVTLEVSDYAGNPVTITKTFDVYGP